MIPQRALIFGVTGQDGAYLALKLREMGVEVAGTCQDVGTSDFWRLSVLGLDGLINIQSCALEDFRQVERIVKDVKPDWVFNVAGVTSLAEADADPSKTLLVNGDVVSIMAGTLFEQSSKARFFQASSAQIFGDPQDGIRLTETSPISPRNVYAEAKAKADDALAKLRGDGYFAATGILFNHESKLRTDRFISRKITRGLVRAQSDGTFVLRLGNLNARRDWSFAGDFMSAAIASLQITGAGRYVFSSGQLCCVRDWVTASAGRLQWSLIWEGQGFSEVARCAESGRVVVAVDPEFYRENDPDGLVGDPAFTYEALDWRPEVSFRQMVHEMVEADIACAK